MSAFWNFVTRMIPGTLAKAEDVNTNFDGVDNAFALVEAEVNKAIQITNDPGVTDVTLNAAARANKLLEFDVNGDIATTTIMGDWKGDHANAAGTDYEIRDVVKDAAGSLGQDNIYICNTTHTSTGSLSTDTAKWDLLIDVAAAAASAAAALVSETNAAASADFLDDRMLGAFSTANEPTLDNDGGALLIGAQYFNTDLNFTKNYTGTIWQLNTANAVDVVNVAAGNIAAVNVQAAINELDAEKAGLGLANTFTKSVYTTKGADIASANDMVLLTDGNSNDITGSVTVNGMTDGIANERRHFHSDGVFDLKHNTAASAGFSSLWIVQGEADITTAAGDEWDAIYDGTAWRIINYNRAANPPILNGKLNTKVIDIGDWNMDTDVFVNVAHGLTYENIRSVEAFIRPDSGSGLTLSPIDKTNASSVPNGDVQIDNTNVAIVRTTGGDFDNVSFNDTSYNRGWITIQYVD